VAEGIELLTGVPAGERDPSGRYPRGTVLYLCAEQLADMAETMRRFRS
jgi:hypothetical protein